MSNDTGGATLPKGYATEVARLSEILPRRLGENLYSLVLYGSTVRGNVVDGVSDLNILIVLNVSTPEAHAAIAEIIRSKLLIEPLVVAKAGLSRSMEVFAIKFRSIQRNYRVLAGADPFTGIQFNPAVLRFLCEQAVRNLRWRIVHAYIRFGQDSKRYQHFLLSLEAQIIVDLAEVLRLNGTEMPNDFEQRIAALSQGFKTDVQVLHDLQCYKDRPHRLSHDAIEQYHSRLFRLMDHVIQWLEDVWPTTM